MAGSKLKKDLNRDGSGLTDIEDNLISFNIIDDLYQPKVLTARISNQADAYEQGHATNAKYVVGDEVAIVDTDTSLTLFRGTVESILNLTVARYGQVIELVARDNLQQLLKRDFRKDYTSGSLAGRHLVIKDIIDDHRYASTSIVTGDALSVASANTTALTYTSTEGHRRPLHVIQDLAREDPWESGATPSNFGAAFYIDEANKFNYFKMASKPSVPSAGLTLQHGGTPGNLVKQIVTSTFEEAGFDLVSECTVSYQDSTNSDQFKKIRLKAINMAPSSRDVQYAVGATLTEETSGYTVKVQYSNVLSSRDGVIIVSPVLEDDSPFIGTLTKTKELTGAATDGGAAIVADIRATVEDNLQMISERHIVGDDYTTKAQAVDAAKPLLLRGSTGDTTGAKKQKNGTITIVEYPMYNSSGWKLVRAGEAIYVINTATDADSGTTYAVTRIEHSQGPGFLRSTIDVADVGIGPGPKQSYSEKVFRGTSVATNIKTTNGTLTAGAGDVVINAKGITLKGGDDSAAGSKLRFEGDDSGVAHGVFYASKDGSDAALGDMHIIMYPIGSSNLILGKSGSAGDVKPGNNNTMDLGVSGTAWRHGHFGTSVTSPSFVGDLTGNVAGTITVADESSDTTTFPLFATAATGNLAPKTGSNLTFNSSTGVLETTTLSATDSIALPTAVANDSVPTGQYGLIKFIEDGGHEYDASGGNSLGFLSNQTSGTPHQNTANSNFWSMVSESDGGSGSRIIFEPIVSYGSSDSTINRAFIGWHNVIWAVYSGWFSGGNGSAASPTHTFFSDVDTGMYRAGTNAIGWSSGGTARLILSGANLYPYTDDAQDFGLSDQRWDDIYATNATIQTSDLRMKENIQPTKLGLDFINDLNPITYKWKKKKEDKIDATHYGIIAQEVVETLKDYGITSLEDFAGIHNDGHGEAHYGARYTEFIPILMKAIQELSAEIKELKEKK